MGKTKESYRIFATSKKKQDECNHPKVVKEYFGGISTGDYICTLCRKVISKYEK